MKQRTHLVLQACNMDLEFDKEVNYSEFNYSSIREIWVVDDPPILALKWITILPVLVLGVLGNATIIGVTMGPPGPPTLGGPQETRLILRLSGFGGVRINL
ncbi:unnamed protein product [Cyprideis torosa]|uniref:Uncharacterized protein n=1 Tax=Cyprideis torosa TaxID=163714 RepID=A0A7R8WA55_9CRUS|nr:unnamed protein product [Cyprideis torosa]CAG0885999.1 unnamed protein product [Cyprideis torosa]